MERDRYTLKKRGDLMKFFAVAMVLGCLTSFGMAVAAQKAAGHRMPASQKCEKEHAECKLVCDDQPLREERHCYEECDAELVKCKQTPPAVVPPVTEPPVSNPPTKVSG